MTLPTPDEIQSARLEMGLTQVQCAKAVSVSENTWQRWETPEFLPSHCPIREGLWELFQIKTQRLRQARVRRNAQLR